MPVECYAQRLLNPFRGCVHVIRYASAEAVTTDGVHWDIYVSNDALVRDLAGTRPVQTSDIRYGSWSADKGLKRGPINLYDDFLAMEEMGAVVYEHLVRTHRQIPFPFRDCLELWLLDAQGRPLALLDSAVEEREITADPPGRWRAGYAALERFSSPAMQALDAGGCRAAEYLERYIQALAGATPTAQWFRREPDGVGCSLTDAGHAPRRLAAAEFPPFFLATSGHDDLHLRLIEDFHAWQAPWLLLLHGLDVQTRRSLERHARSQALEVARQYRLYPEVVDQGQINAALVEAVLLLSQGTSTAKADENLSTFYIELNPGVGEYL